MYTTSARDTLSYYTSYLIIPPQDLPVYEFDDPDAKPFAQRNLPKMLSILTFLTFVTSIKSGLVFIPFLFFAPPGSLCTAGFCELENLRDLFVAAAKNPLSL